MPMLAVVPLIADDSSTITKTSANCRFCNARHSSFAVPSRLNPGGVVACWRRYGISRHVSSVVASAAAESRNAATQGHRRIVGRIELADRMRRCARHQHRQHEQRKRYADQPADGEAERHHAGALGVVVGEFGRDRRPRHEEERHQSARQHHEAGQPEEQTRFAQTGRRHEHEVERDAERQPRRSASTDGDVPSASADCRRATRPADR